MALGPAHAALFEQLNALEELRGDSTPVGGKDVAMPLLEAVIETCDASLSTDAPRHLAVCRWLWRWALNRSQANPSEIIESVESSLRIFTYVAKVYEQHESPHLAHAYEWASNLSRDPEVAMAYARKALDAARSSGLDANTELSCVHEVALGHHRLGRWGEAIELWASWYPRAVEISDAFGWHVQSFMQFSSRAHLRRGTPAAFVELAAQFLTDQVRGGARPAAVNVSAWGIARVADAPNASYRTALTSLDLLGARTRAGQDRPLAALE